MKIDLAIIWLHVTANVFWVGGLVAVALVMLAEAGDAKVRGALANRIYLKLAVPAFGLSFLGGMARLLMDSGYYLKSPWMHAKLLFVVIAIALHHVIGARTKRLMGGEADATSKLAVLVTVFALCATLAVFFVIMRIPGGSAAVAK